MAFNIVNAHFRDKGVILSGMRTALRLITSGVVDPTPLITNAYPLAQIDEAFETAASKPDDFVKAVIEPNNNVRVEHQPRN